ncbi:MAG: hypothetical protein D4S02_03995 [Rhodocyclaceae bacterium]|nr:MAG: hypothetical protein D4S02_03995 [Rhodocyclaceae bacterium]
MRTLRKNETFETHSSETTVSKNTWEPTLYTIVRRPRTENAEVAEPKSAANTAKNIALFLASPIIGLAYVVAMPFVAAAMLAYFAGKAVFNKYPMVKHAAMMIAAPFIGLAFLLVAPLVGLGALGYMGTKALAKN